MSCTVTAVTPTDGVEVQLREYQTGGTGNRLWPASIVLIRYLFGAGGIPAEELPRARIVELGAGTGLVSIALAKAGAGHVITTDGDHQTVKNLRHNVLANKVSKQVHVCKWDWTVAESPCDIDGVTHVLASDIVYAVAPLGDLARTIHTILARRPTAKVLMMLSKRGDGSSLATFLKEMAALALELDLLALDDSHTEGIDEDFKSRLRFYSVRLAST